MKPDFEKWAKELAATYAVRLSDTQYQKFWTALRAHLEAAYEAGCQKGK